MGQQQRQEAVRRCRVSRHGTLLTRGAVQCASNVQHVGGRKAYCRPAGQAHNLHMQLPAAAWADHAWVGAGPVPHQTTPAHLCVNPKVEQHHRLRPLCASAAARCLQDGMLLLLHERVYSVCRHLQHIQTADAVGLLLLFLGCCGCVAPLLSQPGDELLCWVLCHPAEAPKACDDEPGLGSNVLLCCCGLWAWHSWMRVSHFCLGAVAVLEGGAVQCNAWQSDDGDDKSSCYDND